MSNLACRFITRGTKADGRRSKFLVRETRTRNLIQETCIQVAHRTIQVSRTRNMVDDTDNDLAVAATIVLSALSDQIKRKPKRDKWVQPSISRHLALHNNRRNLIQK